SRVRSGVHRAAGAGGPSSLTWVFVAAAAAAVLLLALLASSGSDETLRKPKAAPFVKKEEPREVPPPPLPPAPPPERKAPLPEAPPPVPPLPKPEKPAPPPVEIPAPAPETPKPAPVPPRPEPVPAPEPSTPRPTKAVVAGATLEGLKGDASVRTEKGKEPATEGQTLLPGQGLETGAGDAAAVLRFSDGTRLELAAESRIDQVTNGEGKRIVFDHGVLTADVKKQAPGQPLLVTTPHAEARVIGTKFTLTVKGDATRL